MHSNIKLAGQKLRGKIRRIDKGRVLYTAFLIPTALAMTPLQAHAAGETIWSKASEIMQDVYTQILGISTIAAIVTASIALLLMNFSKSGRTVDESRAWLKRIIITWAILNGLGFIMAYVTPFFSGARGHPAENNTKGKEQHMKKNIVYLIGGIVAGIALCLTAASIIPLNPDYLKDFEG